MISLHDAFPLARWLLLAAWILAVLSLLRFRARWRRGRRTWALPAAWVALILATIWMSAASRTPAAASRPPQAIAKPLSPESQAVWSIVVQRCQVCHSDHATRMTWAAYGLSLDTMEDVERNASPIYRQVVELRGMPMGNATQMTAEERAAIARWYTARPPKE
jgi:uncharacterized membrane protein